MFLDVVAAAKSSCRLTNLHELALASSFGGERWSANQEEYENSSKDKISPTDLRTAVISLLPMPCLRNLRISVALNFLDILNLSLYKSIADGLPALEKLWLGYSESTRISASSESGFCDEKVPLVHLAAFCSMLPNLIDVSVGAVDHWTGDYHQPKWACPSVRSLRIESWVGEWSVIKDRRELMLRALSVYFTNSDLNSKVLQWQR